MSENNSNFIHKKPTRMNPILSHSVSEQDKILYTNRNSIRPRKGDFTPKSSQSEIQSTNSQSNYKFNFLFLIYQLNLKITI
jgi:hypothetical protein